MTTGDDHTATGKQSTGRQSTGGQSTGGESSRRESTAVLLLSHGSRDPRAE